ncbi:ABC transporter permease subunit [Methanosarcinaceae archaeon]|nr:ABC transporter permease subunit [Methanosarcinaceae archaeon]
MNENNCYVNKNMISDKTMFSGKNAFPDKTTVSEENIFSDENPPYSGRKEQDYESPPDPFKSPPVKNRFQDSGDAGSGKGRNFSGKPSLKDRLNLRAAATIAGKDFADRLYEKNTIVLTFVFILTVFVYSQRGSTDYIQIIAVFFPLIGIALGYNAFVSERNDRSLNVLFGHPVFRDSLILGKFLAVAASLFCIVMLSFMIILASDFLNTGVIADPQMISRLLIFFIMTYLYLLVFASFSLFTSVILKDSISSFVAGAVLWILLCFAFGPLILVLSSIITGTSMFDAADPFFRVAERIADISPIHHYAQVTVGNLDLSYTAVNIMHDVNGFLDTRYTIDYLVSYYITDILYLLAVPAVFLTASYVAFIRKDIRSGGSHMTSGLHTKFNLQIIGLIAGKEFADCIRNPVFLLVAATFTIVVLSWTYVKGMEVGYRADFMGMSDIMRGFKGMAMIIGRFAPVLGIVAAFDTVIKEIRSGSMNVLMGHPVYRDNIIAGKLLGSAATVFLIIFVSVNMAAGCLLSASGMQMTSDQIIRLEIFVVLTFLYTFIFSGIAVLVSSAVSKPDTSLITDILIWLVLIVLFSQIAYTSFYMFTDDFLLAEKYSLLLLKLSPAHHYALISAGIPDVMKESFSYQPEIMGIFDTGHSLTEWAGAFSGNLIVLIAAVCIPSVLSFVIFLKKDITLTK